MRVSREKFAENRERILDAAARLFREKGFDGVGVADIMKAAGLTHGGFYGHFASKEDLIAQASCRAAASGLPRWQALSQPAAGPVLDDFVAGYLASAHRDHPEAGCLLASLGSDMARQSEACRAGPTAAMRSQFELLEPLMPGETAQERRAAAMAALATLVGTMVLARISDDEALSDAILAAGRAALTHKT